MCDHRGEPSVESSRGVEMGLSRSKAMRAVADREVVDLRAPVTDGDQASRPRNGSNGHGGPEGAAVGDDEAERAAGGGGAPGGKKKDGRAGKAKAKKKAAKAGGKAGKKAAEAEAKAAKKAAKKAKKAKRSKAAEETDTPARDDLAARLAAYPA